MLDGIVMSGFANNAKVGNFPNSDDRYGSFTVRQSEYKGKNPDGSPNYESAWYNCKVYGRLVDLVEAHIPGSEDEDTRAVPVTVHGELRTDTYETSDGEKRKAVYIRVDDIRSAERLGAGMIAQGSTPRQSVSTGASEPF